jgi:predicted exporter
LKNSLTRALFGALSGFPGRGALLVWLALVLGAIGITVRTHYVADLSAFLPSTPSAEQSVLLDQLRNGVAARLMLIGIEGGTPQQRSEASRKFGQVLRDSGLFEAVHNGDRAQFEGTAKFLFENRYVLSPAVDAQRFTEEGLRAAIDETTALLGTPAGAMIKPVILRDPTGETVRMAEGMMSTESPRTDGGVWVSRNAARAVMLATTKADGSNLDEQARALQSLQEKFAPWREQNLKLLVTGAGTFAVSSRARIHDEVEKLAIAGGVAIIGILLLSFGGSLRTLLSALLPVGCGVLAGISAVSLAFGNVQIGEAVDYAIYYLIQARSKPGEPHATGAKRWLADSWPTVRLGLLTSVCGFAALLFSGFPGLAQLGLFSVAGLSAAALTTRFVFPVVAPDGAPGTGVRRQLGHLVGWMTAVLPRMRWPLAVVALAAAVALAVLPSAWRGNLSSLSPVTKAELQLDVDLRADIGATDNGMLVSVSGPDEAGVLAQAEAAGARLDRLVEAGVITGYESPARLLPSPALQKARRDALPDEATLRASLQRATVDGPLAPKRLEPFVADVQAARQLPLLTLASMQGTPLASALSAQLLPGRDGGPWRALISVRSGPQGADQPRIRAALADLPGSRVVNIGDELGSMYARYLHEATLQALLGGLAVCAVLLLYLRSWRRLGRIALPIVSAVVIVLAGLSATGVTLGILHLVGLLLSVAIGSNYALFYDQIRLQQDAQPDGAPLVIDNDTLASLALANLTAVVSFFLLALSSIPALFAVGQVVAPGILLSLLLSAAFIPSAKR